MKNDNDEKPTRAESGNIRFGDDWNGVFIRGDNAGYYGLMLQCLISDYKLMMKQQNKTPGPFDNVFKLERLMSLLQGSNQFLGNKTQVMKSFEECFVEFDEKKKE